MTGRNTSTNKDNKRSKKGSNRGSNPKSQNDATQKRQQRQYGPRSPITGNFLIDASVILELMLGYKNALTCDYLLKAVKHQLLPYRFYITQFTLHGIEALAQSGYEEFLRDFLLLIYQGRLKVTIFDIGNHLMINSIRKDYDLSFDDATQFLAAQKLAAPILTYDPDFKKCPIQTLTPDELLEDLIED